MSESPAGEALSLDLSPEKSASSSTEPEQPGDAEPASNARDSSVPSRRRIEDQLEALKRRESELRRELAIADHPELAEAIRQLEGAAYGVARAEAKLAQGLTKSEERRRETLSKKVASLTEKRDKLDAQIAELQQELSGLGEERIEGFRSQRREAMERLVACMGAHAAALEAAGLEAAELLPEIGTWMEEIREVAEQLAAKRG